MTTQYVVYDLYSGWTHSTGTPGLAKWKANIKWHGDSKKQSYGKSVPL